MSSEFSPDALMKMSDEYCGLMVERERVDHAIRENEQAVKIQHGQAEELDKRIAAHRITLATAFGIIRPEVTAKSAIVDMPTTTHRGRNW